MNVSVKKHKEKNMTEKIIPQDAFKSKKNFEEFMANHNAPEIISVLADYPKANGKAIVTIADLTQNSETIINVLSEIKNLPQSPFIVWIVANERENLITAAETLNKFSNKDFGIFIFIHCVSYFFSWIGCDLFNSHNSNIISLAFISFI